MRIALLLQAKLVVLAVSAVVLFHLVLALFQVAFHLLHLVLVALQLVKWLTLFHMKHHFIFQKSVRTLLSLRLMAHLNMQLRMRILLFLIYPTETTFRPDQACTRGQIMTFLWRYMDEPAPQGENPFKDVAADAYYADAIAWGAENNIAKGITETEFRPDDTCTRGQIVTFLYRDLA